CPYDKNNQIRACRLPYHLIKWRKNHPDVTNTRAACPFSVLHQLPQAEISHHLSSYFWGKTSTPLHPFKQHREHKSNLCVPTSLLYINIQSPYLAGLIAF
ncbi:hypothetical protein FD754_021944, partial [Muntiacus muntjak]